MKSIEILANGVYLPKIKISNEKLNQEFELQENWIERRCGITNRYYVQEESVVDLANLAVADLLENTNIDIQKIGIIVVVSTSTDRLMPGISFEIQKKLDIKQCICLDLLCGCGGYINAFDLAKKYMIEDNIKYGLIIGTEVLSKYMKKDDIDTRILLGDGAGATLLKTVEELKRYECYIESIGQLGEILTCTNDEKLYMNGKEIYKFGTTKPVENVKKLLQKANIQMEEIKYIVPHQSNIRMMKSMADKLNIPEEKMYMNIKQIGNTFCASIPIALSQMFKKNLLQKGDKIILLGYGGGLNLGSILLEI